MDGNCMMPCSEKDLWPQSAGFPLYLYLGEGGRRFVWNCGGGEGGYSVDGLKPDYSNLENNRLIRIPDWLNNKLEHIGN